MGCARPDKPGPAWTTRDKPRKSRNTTDSRDTHDSLGSTMTGPDTTLPLLLGIAPAAWVALGLAPGLLSVAATLWLVRECFGRRVATMPRCVGCGHGLAGGEARCPECGGELARHGAVAIGSRRERSPTRILLAGAAAFALAIATIAVNMLLLEQARTAIARATDAELAARCLRDVPSRDAAWIELMTRAQSPDEARARRARAAILAEVVRVESTDADEPTRLQWFVETSPEFSRDMVERGQLPLPATPASELEAAIWSIDADGTTLIGEAVLAALGRGASGEPAARRLFRRLERCVDRADPDAVAAHGAMLARIAAHPRGSAILDEGEDEYEEEDEVEDEVEDEDEGKDGTPSATRARRGSS